MSLLPGAHVIPFHPHSNPLREAASQAHSIDELTEASGGWLHDTPRGRHTTRKVEAGFELQLLSLCL